MSLYIIRFLHASICKQAFMTYDTARLVRLENAPVMDLELGEFCTDRRKIGHWVIGNFVFLSEFTWVIS